MSTTKDRTEKKRLTINGRDVIVHVWTPSNTVSYVETADGRASARKEDAYPHLKSVRLHTDDGDKILYQNKAHSETPMTAEELREARKMRNVLSSAFEQVRERLERKKEIKRDMERARRQMERDLEDRRIRRPIQSLSFEDRRKRQLGAGESIISQRFTATHESDLSLTGTVKNATDAFVGVSFDHKDRHDPNDRTEAEKDIAKAAMRFSDVLSHLRM